MHGFFHLLFTPGLLAPIAAMIRRAPYPVVHRNAYPKHDPWPDAGLSRHSGNVIQFDEAGIVQRRGRLTAYGTANATDPKSALIQAIANTRGTLQDTQRSGRANNSQWYLVAKSLPRELSRHIADLDGYATGASMLNNHADDIWRCCDG